VAPPNYAPQRKSVRTMWDLMRCLAIQNNALPSPVRPSFTFDILPIFERMAGLQWVNGGFAAGFGWKGAFDLTSPEALARFSSNGPAEREKRRVVNKAFRRFDEDAWAPTPWPWLYGDAMAIPPVDTPRQNAALSDCQLAMLDKWAEGNFEGAAAHDRGGTGRRAGRDADPRGAGILPRRRLPSGLRDDLAGPDLDDVHEAVPLHPGAAGLGAAQSGRGADLGQRHHPQRAALRAGAGQHQSLDGGAVADGHGQLPLRL